MKRTIFVLLAIVVVFLTVFAVLVVRPVPKVKAHQSCSNRTLFGDYGTVGSGFALVSGSNKPAALVGLLHFDGDGNLTGSNIYTTVNAVVTGPSSITTGGSYDIGPDCTISVSFSTSFASHGVVVGADGREVIGDLENSGGTATGTIDMRKVAEWDDR